MPLPRSPEQLTAAILIVLLIGLVLYDVVVRVTYGVGPTISAVIGDSCRREPMVAFAIGLLVGHWLWSLR